MTREEAKIFLDNLKVCIEEHPIVADWLVEIANRKTESIEVYNGNADKENWQCITVKPIEDEPQTERHLPDYSYEADLGRRIMEQTKRSK